MYSLNPHPTMYQQYMPINLISQKEYLIYYPAMSIYTLKNIQMRFRFEISPLGQQFYIGQMYIF